MFLQKEAAALAAVVAKKEEQLGKELAAGRTGPGPAVVHPSWAKLRKTIAADMDEMDKATPGGAKNMGINAFSKKGS